MTNSADIDVSVVIPCYNEEMNAGPIAQAVIEQLEPLGVSFDIIFIDNHSTDNTVPIIKAMCQRDPRIRLIANTRNFGQMRSPTHGIYAAAGRGYRHVRRFSGQPGTAALFRAPLAGRRRHRSGRA
jgi:cellulose synthase/poly-beta-1,6-N-acetylglucosamine synthase-like glycosyltransferase